MSDPYEGETLAKQRTVAIVLRLVLDSNGELSHGQVVDTAGQATARWAGWDALVPTLKSWLRRTANR